MQLFAVQSSQSSLVASLVIEATLSLREPIHNVDRLIDSNCGVCWWGIVLKLSHDNIESSISVQCATIATKVR